MNKMGRREKSFIEKFHIIYIDTVLSRREKINPHFLNVGCIRWICSKVYGMEKGKWWVTWGRETWQTLPQPEDQGQHQQW